MKNVSFKNAHEVKDYKLPFSLDEQALTDWLAKLLAQGHEQSVESLFCVIETLYKLEMEAEQRLVLVQKIMSFLNAIVDRVEEQNEELSFPVLTKHKELLEKIVWSYQGLARCFVLAAKNSGEQTFQVIAWYQSLLALSKAYLIISSTHCLPGTGFWRLCYHIYLCAEQRGVLLEPLAAPELAEETIAKLFKQIIIFSLSGVDQYRAREMKTIFQFLGDYAIQIEIKKSIKEDRAKGVYVFDLKNDAEPRGLASISDFQILESSRVIEPVVLAKRIYQAQQQEKTKHGMTKSINKALFRRLVKTLGKSQKRSSTRVSDETIHHGISGFNYLSSYLRIKNGERRVEPVKENKDGFELLSRGEEKMHQMNTILKDELEHNDQIKSIFQVSSEAALDGEAWSAVATSEDELIDDIKCFEFELIDSSAKGYELKWDNLENRIKQGELFGIESSDGQRLEIAIIRRINQLSDTVAAVRLGVEVIGYESIPVAIEKANGLGFSGRGILLPGIQVLKEPDTLVYKAGEYELGEFITLQQNNKKQQFRLSKLLSSTPSISHVELFLVPNIE